MVQFRSHYIVAIYLTNFVVSLKNIILYSFRGQATAETTRVLYFYIIHTWRAARSRHALHAA